MVKHAKYYMLKKQVTIQKGLNILTKNPIILIYHFNNVSTKNWQFLKNKIKKLENIQCNILQNKLVEDILIKLEKNGDILEKKESYYLSSIPLENKLLKYSKSSLEKITSKKVMGLRSKRVNPNQITQSQKTSNNFQKEELFSKKSDIISKNFLLKELFQGPTLVLGCQTKDQIITISALLKKLKNWYHFIFVGGLYENQLISHHGINKIVELNTVEQQKFFMQHLKSNSCSFFLIKQYLVLNSLLLLQILKKGSDFEKV